MALHSMDDQAGAPDLKGDAHKRRSYSPKLFFLSDTAALAGGCLLAWGFAITINNQFYHRHALLHPLDHYGLADLLPFVAIHVACLIAFYSTGHYSIRMPFWLETKKVILILAVATMVECVLLCAAKRDFSRLWLFADGSGGICLVILLRSLIRRYARRQGRWDIPTLLIGGGETARHALHALQSEKSLGYAIVAQIQDLLPAFLQAGRSWEGLCRHYGADYIVIALDGEELAQARHLLAQLMRESLPYSVSPPISPLPVAGMVPHYIINHDVMLLTHNCGLGQPISRFIKRACDIVLSMSGLIVASPIFLILIAHIRYTGGPAFFTQERIGRKGVAFACYKFRTMVTNGEALLERHLDSLPQARHEWKETQKLKDDPRVTAIGTWMRRLSLDELPQLWNILKGDMSLVGPRPIVADEVEKYQGDIAYYHSVRPGLTGQWQVSGRNDVSYDQRVLMDSWYVRNWSLWHDMTILFKTLPAIVKGKGAY